MKEEPRTNSWEQAREQLIKSDEDIARLLGPKLGVAFVGSANVDAAARMQFKRYGDVPIYIVNPKGGDAGDISIVPSVLDLPDEVDLVVVRVAPKAAGSVIEQCGQRGIKQALIFTDGYSETGPDGAALEQELCSIVERSGVRVIGPNTNDNAFERFPDPVNHRGRSIALITQSGANGRSVVEGVDMGASFYRWVTTGNEVDLEVADFIHHFAGVPEVGVIALYVEGFRSPTKLRLALQRAIEAGKPVVAIKIGATERGAKAAASHTGHLAGSDAVIEGLFRQFGVTRVRDVDELLETANMFSKVPLEAGTQCAFYTVSGGTAALMAENADACGLSLPENPETLREAIYQYIPRNVSVVNPVDNGGVFVMRASPQDRQRVLELIGSNPEVDLVVVGLNAAYGPLSDRMAQDILAWAPTAPKPALAVWTSIVTNTQGYRDLVASGVPIFRSFGKCMRALAARDRYLKARAGFTPSAIAVAPLPPESASAFACAGVMPAQQAATVLGKAGIRLASDALVQSAADAVEAADRLGYPVVLKLMSPHIPHKTEMGLVRLGVGSAEEVERIAIDFLERGMALAGAGGVDGLLVQEQVPRGVEMIIGLTQDEQFGPALTIGAGGIFAEILRDAATMPLPVTENDVRGMISGLKMAPLLEGARGAAPGDVDGLVRMACAVAELGRAAGGWLAELDLNPVVVLQDRVVAVDALLVAAES